MDSVIYHKFYVFNESLAKHIMLCHQDGVFYFITGTALNPIVGMRQYTF